MATKKRVKAVRRNPNLKWMALALIIGAGVGGFLLWSPFGESGASRVSAYTYNDFSRISQQASGSFYDQQGNKAGQWGWHNEGKNHWGIVWDAKYPGDREHFHLSKDGSWVLLDGWNDRSGTYKQRISKEKVGKKMLSTEWYGSGDCSSRDKTRKRFKSAGDRQHYVRKVVGDKYCLLAIGTITKVNKAGKAIAKPVHFRHRQFWSAPVKCSNRYIKNRLCIKQHELWADDNHHPMRGILDRTQYIAKGLGMAFKIDQHYKWVPNPKNPRTGTAAPHWEADMKCAGHIGRQLNCNL